MSNLICKFSLKNRRIVYHMKRKKKLKFEVAFQQFITYKKSSIAHWCIINYVNKFHRVINLFSTAMLHKFNWWEEQPMANANYWSFLSFSILVKEPFCQFSIYDSTKSCHRRHNPQQVACIHWCNSIMRILNFLQWFFTITFWKYNWLAFFRIGFGSRFLFYW